VTKLHLRRFNESRESLTKALDMQRYNLRIKRLTSDREELKTCLLEVADTLVNLGGLGLEWVRHEGSSDYILSESENHLAEALEIRCTVFGSNHPLAIQAKSLHEMAQARPQLKSTVDTLARMKTIDYNNVSLGKNLDIDKKQFDSSLNKALNHESMSDDIQENWSSIEGKNTQSNLVDSQDRPMYAQHEKVNKKNPDFASEKLNLPRPKTISWNQDSEKFREEIKQVKWQYIGDANSKASKNFKHPDDTISSILTDEEDEILPANKKKQKKPESTKVYVEPHHIPRYSPVKVATRQENSISESDSEMAVHDIHDDIDKSIDSPFSDIVYDSEESCLLNRSVILTNTVPEFMLHNDKEEDATVSANMSSHEIMIVQPITIPLHSSKVGQLENKLLENDKGGIRSLSGKLFSNFYGGKNCELEKSEDGVAPLYHNGQNIEAIHLSPTMDETLSYDLSDMHASASRHLKVSELSPKIKVINEKD
jgi:hypothetical protein